MTVLSLSEQPSFRNASVLPVTSEVAHRISLTAKWSGLLVAPGSDSSKPPLVLSKSCGEEGERQYVSAVHKMSPPRWVLVGAQVRKEVLGTEDIVQLISNVRSLLERPNSDAKGLNL